MKYHIRIEQILDEVIEAETEDEAFNIAWEMFSQNNEVEAFSDIVTE